MRYAGTGLEAKKVVGLMAMVVVAVLLVGMAYHSVKSIKRLESEMKVAVEAMTEMMDDETVNQMDKRISQMNFTEYGEYLRTQE